MRTRRLGRGGPELSVVGYGAWEASGHWGGDLDEKRIVEAIHAGIDAGINWIDTAEVYGPHTSEEIVGRAVKGRDDVYVATKVAPWPGGSGVKRDDVFRACDASRARLGRDVIDLYQIHWPDENTPVEETWESMAELQDRGLVRWLGVSNFNRSLIERCEKIRHVDSLQPHHSALHRDNEDLIAWCASNGTGAVVFGPLAYGLLSGAINAETAFDPDDWRAGGRGFGLYAEFFSPEKLPRHLEAVEGLRPVADGAGMSLADLAIAWVLTRPGVTSAIVGSRNPAHVRQNARAADIVLDDATVAEVERVAGP
jgi:aryl-alcohol dehydrogenase-like predicted oxidoreductase